jgi:branched-subunit amino acid transport protein
MTASELLVVLGMAVAVYLPKLIPLVVVSETITNHLRPWLRYVAPAILGALVGPAILTPVGQLAPPGLAHLPFVFAFAAALATRRMLPSLAAGLVALLIVFVLQR